MFFLLYFYIDTNVVQNTFVSLLPEFKLSFAMMNLTIRSCVDMVESICMHLLVKQWNKSDIQFILSIFNIQKIDVIFKRRKLWLTSEKIFDVYFQSHDALMLPIGGQREFISKFNGHHYRCWSARQKSCNTDVIQSIIKLCGISHRFFILSAKIRKCLIRKCFIF